MSDDPTQLAGQVQAMAARIQALEKQLEQETDARHRAESSALASDELHELVATHTAELQKSEQWYRHILHSITDSCFVLDRQWRYAMVNAASASLVGMEPDDMIGQTLTGLFPGVEKTAFYESYERSMTRRTTERVVSSFRLPDGREEIYEVLSYPASEGILCIARKVTDAKRVEEKLRLERERLSSLTSAMTITQENERRHIAKALHDQVGQLLVVTKMKLSAVRQRIASPELSSELETITELLSQVIQYTRTLTFELSPPVLHELGLEAALEWLVEQVEQQADVDVLFIDDLRTKPVADDFRVLIFRAVRELLSNVVIHSRASHVKVTAARCGGCIRVTVQDDGVGFEAAELDLALGEDRQETKFGILGIQERMRAVEGHFAIESMPGRGTCAILMAPVVFENVDGKGGD